MVDLASAMEKSYLILFIPVRSASQQVTGIFQRPRTDPDGLKTN
jgi:hypothetical protein